MTKLHNNLEFYCMIFNFLLNTFDLKINCLPFFGENFQPAQRYVGEFLFYLLNKTPISKDGEYDVRDYCY